MVFFSQAMVIYELDIPGLTLDPSSRVPSAGTAKAALSKIDHVASLGKIP